MKSLSRILFFCPSATGGVAEHAFYQAQALGRAGANVICLVSPSFLAGRQTDFEKVTCLANPVPTGRSRWIKKIAMTWRILRNQLALAVEIVKRRPDLVLLDSYSEYFAPLWVTPHWLLARLGGIKYGANLHDPIRNFRVGPKWWHELSVRMAYWPLDFVLIHDKLQEPSPVPARVRVVEVPVGLYEFAGGEYDAAEIRKSWGVTDAQKVFLAFGFVRDGKNLDLAIRALANVPDAFLVIAGSVASANDKPFIFYRELAAKIGVADRCRFYEGFVTDEVLGNYFVATDFVLLTYASSFHSQSGVLNIAARARKPVLASAAPSPMIESVRIYKLGITVKPDCSDAIAAGMRQLIDASIQPRWGDYELSASWSVNAQRIIESSRLAKQSVTPTNL